MKNASQTGSTEPVFQPKKTDSEWDEVLGDLDKSDYSGTP